MVQLIWVNIGSGEGLVSGSAKPSPEPMLRFNHRYSVAFTCEQFKRRAQSDELINLSN